MEFSYWWRDVFFIVMARHIFSLILTLHLASDAQFHIIVDKKAEVVKLSCYLHDTDHMDRRPALELLDGYV